MIKKPFFSFGKPKLQYSVVDGSQQDVAKEIPLPAKVTLLQRHSDDISGDIVLKVGDNVKTGQRLEPFGEGKGNMISTATGTITDISQKIGYLGQSYTAITITTVKKDQWCEEFKNTGKTPSPQNSLKFFTCLPGNPDFASLLNEQAPVDTIVINGVDKDLLVTANQFIVNTRADDLAAGVDFLKEITGINRVIIVVPDYLASQAGKTGAEVKVIGPAYPNTLPELIAQNVLAKVVPVGKKCEEIGVGFINAETVAALKTAFNEEKVPTTKTLTVIDKNYSKTTVTARIGTSVKDILAFLNIETKHGDRLVLGGPMSGHDIYSDDMPILPDSDAIMVQDKEQVLSNSDNPCVNCGECVRACPAKVPVNMLIRLLENGLYEEAANDYDLLSCIECGLCSYVCLERIPIFHYIMLGKHEFALIKNAEESNA